MAERYQKTFISVREFIESWDKELYELNNLDFFMFLIINHLGNQLEKRYFTDQRRQTQLFLDFEQIGTLCFNVGDSFEYFLEENCLGTCPIDCPRDLDGEIDSTAVKLEDRIKRKLELLQSFLIGNLDKEQCFRIDIMNHVVLDTLLQFYSDELEMEFEENDIALLELAEFMENVMLEFIRFEGQTLLNKPFDNALEYFEELLQRESEENLKNKWTENGVLWQESTDVPEWEKNNHYLENVFLKFLNDQHYNPKISSPALEYDINYFSKYLKENAKIEKLSELTEHHLAEFLSVWLVREFVLSDTRQIPHIFRATARFITFIYHQYHINYKKEFLKFYDHLKNDLPRVIRATNAFIADYNPLDAVLTSEQPDLDQEIGFFEVVDILDKLNRLLSIRSIFKHRANLKIKLDSSAFFRLHRGDILHASIIKKTTDWEILEIHFIYPGIAMNYLQ